MSSLKKLIMMANQVDDKPIPYLAFEALEDDLQVSITKSATQYSSDRVNWIDLPAEQLTEPIGKGEKVWFRANITPDGTSSGIGTFSCTKQCNLEGSLMSLIYGDMAGDILTAPRYAFASLFLNNTKIVKVSENLIPPNLSQYSCLNMFKGCSRLINTPIMPISLNTDSCNSMLYSTGITELYLPATTMKTGCYRTIGQYTKLEKVTILATNLVGTCLFNAFSNNPNLSYIKILILDAPNSVTNSMSYWVGNVAPTGTIVLNKNIEWNPDDYRGVNGIPAKWEVKYCDPDNLDDIRDYREIDKNWEL